MSNATERKGVTTRRVTELSRGVRTERDDELVVEEPLEIRVSGETLAITMRTPGDDAHLALGFLLAEGLIASIEDVGTIAPCGRPTDPGYGNALDVAPGPGMNFDLGRVERTKRGTLTTSACGVCGRQSIDDMLARCPIVARDEVVPSAHVAMAPERLRAVQRAFARTGGLHAAGALDSNGEIRVSAEDVGRHNAVDKVIGQLVRDRQIGPSAPLVLVVSGRASFEIVQKAAMAGIPIVASVSAASSLAAGLAERLGITLAGFVRDGRMVVYTHPGRLAT